MIKSHLYNYFVVEYLGKFWVDWNKLVEKSSIEKNYYRYKMEDIDEKLIYDMLNMVGLKPEYKYIKKTFNQLKSLKIHSGYLKNHDISLDMLSDNTLREVKNLAENYGYKL